MWIVGQNYHQPVILSGHEFSTGAPVWFDMHAIGSSPGDPMTSAVLDPAVPNRGSTTNASGLWNIWGDPALLLHGWMLPDQCGVGRR